MLKTILSYAVAAGLAFSAVAMPLSASADDLETIKAAGEFKFANSGAYPPFIFVDDRNEVVGFDVDIGNEIARRLGVKGTGVSTAWDGIIAGLLAGKYASVIGSMTITPEPGQPELFLELKAGRIQAMIVDAVPVSIAVKDTGEKVVKLDVPEFAGTEDKIGIAVRKGNPELKAAMQKALDDMMADGTYEAIAMKWVGADIR